jgi:hypothetical protein
MSLRKRLTVSRLSVMVLPIATLVLAIALKPAVITPPRPGREPQWETVTKPESAPRNAQLTRAELADFKPVPAYTDKIPVVVLHGVNNQVNQDAITQRQFALDLALLSHLRFHTISAAQYTAWHEHKKVRLPSRPILITFDDGRVDSWTGASRVLAEYHMRATMFVIVGFTTNAENFYLNWSQIKEMQRSGQWDIEFHANMGHVPMLEALPRERPGYWYDGPAYYPSCRCAETLAHYEMRVTDDIRAGVNIMEGHGYPSTLMALPYTADGTKSGPTVHKALMGILDKYFATVFIQNNKFSTNHRFESSRYALYGGVTLAQFYDFLRQQSTTWSMTGGAY